FWCGAVPSSLIVPVMLAPEGGAALTPRCEITAKSISISAAARIANILCRISVFMNSVSSVKLLVLTVRLGLVCRGFRRIWIDWLQAKLPCDVSFLGVHGLQGAQIEHQVPGLVGLYVVGKRRHRRAVEAGHEDT